MLAVMIDIGSTIFGQFARGFNGPSTIDAALTLILAAVVLLGLSNFGPRNHCGSLKMSADRTALRGVANLVTLNAARPGKATMNAGMTAKHFATSLAMEKAVRAPR